jgi:hypothetical protein
MRGDSDPAPPESAAERFGRTVGEALGAAAQRDEVRARIALRQAAEAALFCAAEAADVALVADMLANDPTLALARDETGATPLHVAAAPDVVRRLLAAGADPSVRDAAGRTAAEAARIARRADVAAALGAVGDNM